MTVNMTMSLPDDVAEFVRQQGNASAYTARILRREMLRQALAERDPRAIEVTKALVGEPDESEEEALARWVEVGRR
ncbi:hypothetical protein ACFQLX_15315 [Streptomyces polyrhachis]|uniref:Antitoxin n=1 Tax=Streptomyces polyrhachis TaxID=1282885 RepID=A0ABW2GFN9_9ACTN